MVDYQHMKPSLFLWLKFDSLSSWQQGLPGHSPGVPWPAATYGYKDL